MATKEKVTVKSEGNFDLRELASMPSFYLPKVNHAGDKIAFYWDETGRIELYTMNIDGSDITQISDGEVPRTLRAGFIWSRDDSEILFAKDKEGDEKHNIMAIDVQSHETRQLTDTPNYQEYIVDSSPDGNWYTINSNREGQMNLFRISKDGEEVQQITAHENPAIGGKFSKDGEWLAYSSNEEGDLKNHDIYLARPDGSEVKRVVQLTVGSENSFADWSEDSSYFAFTTDKDGIKQAGIYNLEDGSTKYFGEGKYEEYAAKLTGDDNLIVLSNRDASISPIIYDVETGEKEELEFPPGIAAGGEVAKGKYLFLTVNRDVSPSSLVRVDLDTKDTEVLLDTDTGNINPDLFVESQYIKYESTDGTEIPAVLYTPRDYDEDKSYPAIVNPHGGPTAQYFRNFSLFAQFLTDRGFVLLQPNVRGSTGYGVEFRDACINDWGGKDHEDWKAGRKWLVENTAADPERIVVYGGSYGGYATLWCMTKSPELWGAGVAWVPVSHLKNMYEESMEHFKYYLREQMGDPQENEELWEERSPLNYAENIQSPLLLVHGKNDPRCPVNESRNFVDALEEAGFEEGPNGDFEYVEFGDEGHGGMSDIQMRIRTMELLIDFLNRRMN